MRDFFKQILSNLYIYCGNRQIEKMSDEEIKFLLDALERMSKIYSYIPEDKQKEIILTCLVSDREYQNINVRTVSKWLEQNGKIYFQQNPDQGKLTEENYTPLTGEAREQAIKMALEAVAKTQTNWTSETVKGNGAKMREQLDEVGVKFDEEKHKKETIVRETSALEDSLGAEDVELKPCANCDMDTYANKQTCVHCGESAHEKTENINPPK